MTDDYGKVWSAQQCADLERLWMQTQPKLSAAAIAKILKRTKNAVIGRVTRMGLSSRPSPILRRAGERRAPPRVEREQRPAVRTLDALPSLAEAPAPQVTRRETVGDEFGCTWPIGEPRTSSFRYCDAQSLPGRPYCHEHTKIATVKKPERHLSVRERVGDSPYQLSQLAGPALDEAL